MAKTKILIIEDEPVHLNVMKSKLEKAGFDVIFATDGELGLNMVMSEKPALVLLDVILPKMNGFGVLENLKKNHVATPVIIVSNSGQPVEVDKALKLGAKDFLVKAEFNPSDVLEKVIKIVGKPGDMAFPSKSASESKIEIINKTSNPMENQAAMSNTSAVAGTGNSDVATGGKNRILVVEDDKFLRDLIIQKLKREGFITYEGFDGEEGLKVAKKELPDIMLLDLILPGLDGFEVLRLLKADEPTSNIPIIVLSNLGQKEDIDRAMSGGAEDFMIKAHFTPTEIVAKIKSILKKKYF
ncbi:response regulator [Candidatus Giovannonibacteria bacterium]|nr:response regulator [Candidatus Giovannonibacteria bacterium]